jgi:2-octaprenyl-6-methoxyphenol hydroxylase
MSSHDIVIVGAGPAGMALALALLYTGKAPVLLDARSRSAVRGDPRVLSLSHGSRQTLERLGVWEPLTATPIETIHVSQRGGFGRTVLRAAEHGLPALGYVIEADALAATLEQALSRRGITWLDESKLERVAVNASSADMLVTMRDVKDVLSARLVAYAEGAVSAGKASVVRDYDQDAILCTATLCEPHRSTAYERFTPDGPIALLPLRERYAVVLTASADTASEIVSLDDAGFLARLQHEFPTGPRFASVTPRSRFPLTLRFRHEPMAARQVWVGNSAQTLHPVAGQGFNLALRDVWELAEVLSAADVTDPGAPEVLRRYAALRRLDRNGLIRFTDALIHVFSNDNVLLGAARGAGLMLLDLSPPLRGFLARRMIFGARAWL